MLTFVGVILAAGPAWAQDAVPQDGAASASDSAAAAGDQDIVVTARRTSETLRNVPLAVTTLSGDTLAQQQLRTIADLARVSPSLSFTPPSSNPFQLVISLRGQVQSDASLLNLDTSVGFYIDDFYLSRPNPLIAFGTFDLERVEVSRGPQGTLFGRNATGGNVRYITRKPDGEFGGYLRAQYGNYNHREIEGAVNIPLIGEQLAVRLAGLTVDDRGYQRSLVNNSPYGDVDSQAAGVSVVARPLETLELNFA